MMKKIIIFILFFLIFIFGLYLWTQKNNFQQEKAQDSFRSFVVSLVGTHRLQVAELEQIETFERVSSQSLFWNQLELPDVVAEMIIPVKYSYAIDLDKPFQFKLENRKLIVRVPTPELLTPAPDLAKVRLQIKKGSFLRDEKEVLKELRMKSTNYLYERGEQSKPLILETARSQVKKFIEQWLLTQEFKDSQIVIEVLLQEEVAVHP